MGKIHLFTQEQQFILDQVENEEFIQKNFYFTGGTALSYIYLQHRYSDDIDLFTEHPFDTNTILSILSKWSKNYEFTITLKEIDNVRMFDLLFKNNTSLKVDFVHYPFKRVEKSLITEKLFIDSLLDIAINKVLTVNQRTQVKDFVDLYYLLDTFTIWDLMQGVQVKFGVQVDPLLLASDLLKVDSFQYMPRMIKPLTLQELRAFFKQKSKELGMESVE